MTMEETPNIPLHYELRIDPNVGSNIYFCLSEIPVEKQEQLAESLPAVFVAMIHEFLENREDARITEQVNFSRKALKILAQVTDRQVRNQFVRIILQLRKNQQFVRYV